jgi:hypothetical protein
MSPWHHRDASGVAGGQITPWIAKTSMAASKNFASGLRPAGQRLRPAGQDAVSLQVMARRIFGNFFELKKAAANSIDAAHSIRRNISEGESRRR